MGIHLRIVLFILPTFWQTDVCDVCVSVCALHLFILFSENWPFRRNSCWVCASVCVYVCDRWMCNWWLSAMNGVAVAELPIGYHDCSIACERVITSTTVPMTVYSYMSNNDFVEVKLPFPLFRFLFFRSKFREIMSFLQSAEGNGWWGGVLQFWLQ